MFPHFSRNRNPLRGMQNNMDGRRNGDEEDAVEEENGGLSLSSLYGNSSTDGEALATNDDNHPTQYSVSFFYCWIHNMKVLVVSKTHLCVFPML